VAAQHDGSFVVRGDGASMAPLYPSGTVLVIRAGFLWSTETRRHGDLSQQGGPADRSPARRPIPQRLAGRRTRQPGLRRRIRPAGNLLGVVTSAYMPVDLPLAGVSSYVAGDGRLLKSGSGWRRAVGAAGNS